MQAMNALEQEARLTGIEPEPRAWPMYLWACYSRFKDKPLQDSVEQPIENVNLPDAFEQLRLDILRNANLKEFSPPIPWGEVFSYFLKDRVDNGDRESLKELDRFFPSLPLGIECGLPPQK